MLCWWSEIDLQMRSVHSFDDNLATVKVTKGIKPFAKISSNFKRAKPLRIRFSPFALLSQKVLLQHFCSHLQHKYINQLYNTLLHVHAVILCSYTKL